MPSIGAPLAVAALVLLIYGGALAHFYRNGHSARDFVLVGHFFFDRQMHGRHSQAIDRGPVRPTHPTGYDGQFYYYIAIDPAHAAPYMDVPAYRYQRIAYPMAARMLALGQSRLVPYSLIAVNLIAITAGVLGLAGWLVRRGLPVWPAAIWGLHPGQIFSFELDLADAAGYGVAAAALWLRDHSLLAAGGLFGLAGLTRDTTLVFPAALFLADLWRLRNIRQIRPWAMVGLAAFLAIAPFAGWKLFLQLWLGNGVPLSDVYTPIPFGGLTHEVARSPELLPIIVAPMLLCFGALVLAVTRRIWRVELLLLGANLLAFVVFLNYPIYEVWLSAPRAGLGAVLAAVLLLPLLRERAWFWLAGGFWLWVTPLWLLRPVN